MSERTDAALGCATDLQMLHDYVVELDDALAAGDERRAACAVATIAQAAHLLGNVIDPADRACAALHGTRPASALAAGTARR